MFIYEIIVVLAILAMDIGSKYWVCSALGVVNRVQTLDDISVIKHIISFSYSENTGASWGLFKDRAGMLAVATAIAMVALVVFLFFSKKESKFFRICLVMILAGGLGNLYDRIVFGYVRDFIYTEFINFPTYNLADCFLTVSTVMLCVYAMFFMSGDKSPDSGKDEANPPAYPSDANGNLLGKNDSDK
ncbi:MAG: signal peptidase II [Clostridia bacterium]